MTLLSTKRLINLGSVFFFIGIAVLAYFKGYSNGEAKIKIACLQEKNDAVTRAVKKAEEVNNANRHIVDNFYKEQEQAKAEIKIIEKEVIRYVDKHRHNDGCNLDADGVRLINDLINIANSESPEYRGSFDAAVSQNTFVR